jgi:PAB-dependent poly(A)-specific ribonuclease subunit 2
MPYFDTQLLSAWPAALISKTSSYCGPQRIPTQVLASMKYNDKVAYATLPKELRGRRNMAMSVTRKSGARFRSDKGVEVGPDHSTPDQYDAEIPRMYRRVEIEYSKFGVEDFDFGFVTSPFRYYVFSSCSYRFYNKTEFSGLETHILNSYTNSLVQLMHYVSPIRQLAKAHISVNCPREHCLFCELGFISRMLEDARGTNCQASNFCKTVGVLAQGSILILIDSMYFLFFSI